MVRTVSELRQGAEIGVLLECDGVLVDVHMYGHRVAFNRAFAVCPKLWLVQQWSMHDLPNFSNLPVCSRWGWSWPTGSQKCTTTYSALVMAARRPCFQLTSTQSVLQILKPAQSASPFLKN